MRTPDLLPQTIEIALSEAINRLPDVAARVAHGEERLILHEGGVPVAALVSVEDLERLQRLDREWEETTRALERFSAAFADVPVEELEAKVDEIIAEGRARAAEERRSA